MQKKCVFIFELVKKTEETTNKYIKYYFYLKSNVFGINPFVSVTI